MLIRWRHSLSAAICIPQRWILAVMGFLAMVNSFTMRVSMNIAITEMVVPRNDSGSISDGYCPANIEEASEVSWKERDAGEYFDWSESLQGLILSVFYWGYLVAHIPGGILAEKFGGKWCLTWGILSTAVFTLATPLAIEVGGANLLILLRLLEGLGEGTIFPSLSALLASWIPLSERSKLGSLVFGGGQIGTVLGTYISGELLARYHWSSVFYFFGILGILWALLFVFLCYSDPESHPFITQKEKDYLRQELGRLERDKNLPPTPWRAIFTNVPMLALICAQIGHDWGFYVMVTDLPKYMSDVLNFSIKQNGLFSSLPYLSMWIVSISSGVLGDWLIKRNYLSLTNSRKMWTTIGAIGPAFFIMFASYAGCSKIMVIVHFTIAMGLMGTFYPGMKVNILDLSPNYAGTLMAISNGIGAVTGIIAPALVGIMTPNRSLYEWRVVFWISFVIFVATSVVYVIWASGKVQDFNEPEKKNEDLVMYQISLETPDSNDARK